ncbi:MAG: ribonucleotide reductase subunit alpha [Rhodanobacteraceae bacterium]|nr:MAG: ribonucleotide reductase subunit alpha [Rhodanobacteraceae bacterium]
MLAELETFEDLIRAAREQPVRQRLLLVFVKAVLPGDAKAGQVNRFHAKQGGALVPVMYVDKAEYELSSFEDIVAEAEHTAGALGSGVETDWDLMIVGCLDGHGTAEPTPQEVDASLHDLLRALRLGQSLAHLVAFDRQGHPVEFAR